MARGLGEQAKEEYLWNETWAFVLFGLDGEFLDGMNPVPLVPFRGRFGIPALYMWSWILGCDILVPFDETKSRFFARIRFDRSFGRELRR